MTEKVLIFDSGTLINLSMNGLLYILESLKTHFKGKLIITKAVKYETVDRPIGISRFELGALQVKNLLDAGILELSSSLGIPDVLIQKRTGEIRCICICAGFKYCRKGTGQGKVPGAA